MLTHTKGTDLPRVALRAHKEAWNVRDRADQSLSVVNIGIVIKILQHSDKSENELKLFQPCPVGGEFEWIRSSLI